MLLVPFSEDSFIDFALASGCFNIPNNYEMVLLFIMGLLEVRRSDIEFVMNGGGGKVN